MSAQLADVYACTSVNSGHQSIRSILSDERGMEDSFRTVPLPEMIPISLCRQHQSCLTFTWPLPHFDLLRAGMGFFYVSLGL